MTAINGPFQTSQDAARHSLWHAEGRDNGRSMTECNLAQLCRELSGVDLGDWDKAIIGWLAGYEPGTVTVICGLIRRACHAKSAG